MNFDKVREEPRGDLILRLLRRPSQGGYVGVVVRYGSGQLGRFEGTDAVELWSRLEKEAARADKAYFGHDGACAKFLRHFPDGFSDNGYASHERNYKIAAKAALDKAVPLEKALGGVGFGEAVLAAYQGTNLLDRFEKAKLGPLFRGASGDAFIRAAARFALDGSGAALQEMADLARPSGNAKWTVVSYLPFLWRPDRHVFLKPTVMKGFAASVGHPFANVYKPRPEPEVYASLLDMAAQTRAELVKAGPSSLKPRDFIDVQSFIWVVGYYQSLDAAAS